jgi:hypothetical protein
MILACLPIFLVLGIYGVLPMSVFWWTLAATVLGGIAKIYYDAVIEPRARAKAKAESEKRHAEFIAQFQDDLPGLKDIKNLGCAYESLDYIFVFMFDHGSVQVTVPHTVGLDNFPSMKAVIQDVKNQLSARAVADMVKP